MKALTLWQPWAWWVASGQKPVENRPWKPPASAIGTTIAIHAGQRYDCDALSFIEKATLVLEDRLDADGLVSGRTGAVLGVARITGYVQEGQLHPDPALESPWFFGPFGWTLDKIVTLKDPVPCKGALGLWRLPDDICEKVAAQLR